MKLYVEEGNEKLYLEYTAATRQKLFEILGQENFLVKSKRYNINQVFAEPDTSVIGMGALVGGTIGTIFLPFLGTLLGSAAGISSAHIKNVLDYERVKIFNNSKFN